jgi:dipeptidyl aminopeptidase/acylaminoacyl peptidase
MQPRNAHVLLACHPAESGQITWVSVQHNSNPHHSHASTLTQTTLPSSSGSSSSDCRSHLLALYPSPSDPSTTVPFTFVNVSNTIPDYCKTGKAFVPLKLLNFRTPGFVLHLVSNGTFYPVILAESAVISNSIANAPGQIHLALHADGQSIVVQWVSGSRDPQQLQYSRTGSTSRTAQAVQDEASRQYSGASIKWPPSEASTRSSSSGKDKRQQQTRTVQSSSTTYTSDMMCGVPANSFGFLDPGYLHSAVIPAAHIGHQQQLHYR